jgi:hypothetical protein
MMYAKIENGLLAKYPYSFFELRIDHPNVSFPAFWVDEDVKPFGMVPVEPSPYPGYNVGTHKIVEVTPILVNGKLIQQWSIVALLPQEAAELRSLTLNAVRIERNQRLADSDWTQLADAPLTAAQKSKWALYRKKLRDMMVTVDPFDPFWPVAPEHGE